MTYRDTVAEIEDELSPELLAYWNGFGWELIDELVEIADNQGVAAAVQKVRFHAGSKRN